MQSLVIFPLTIFFFVPVYYNFWHYPTLEYYQRFYRFATKQLTPDEYVASFNTTIPINYEIAQFVEKETKKDDRIFVWGGNDASIYALSRRIPVIKYTIDYHINDFTTKELVLDEIVNKKPVLIVFTGNKSSFPGLYNLLLSNYVLIEEINNSGIWRIIGNNIDNAGPDQFETR